VCRIFFHLSVFSPVSPPAPNFLHPQGQMPQYCLNSNHNTTHHIISIQLLICSGLGSSVGIATELRAGRSGDRVAVGARFFLTRPDLPWGPRSLLYNGHRVFPGGKERPGRVADPSPPSSVVVRERVELNLYSPYVPYGLYRASVPVEVCTLPFTYSFGTPQCDVIQSQTHEPTKTIARSP